MKPLLLFTFILIFLCLIYLFREQKKNMLITILCTLLIIEIIIQPKQCITYSIDGAKLFFTAVFPSLFPFLVIANIMISYNGVKIYSKLLGSLICKPLRLPKECSIAVIISFLCGYPLGAKYSCTLYEKGLIDYSTCERLINIATNPSPLFVVGSVATAMFHDTYAGYLLLLTSYLSCFLVSIFLPPQKRQAQFVRKNEIPSETNSNVGVILKDCVDNAISTTLFVGGFIVIFYVITNIIKNNAEFGIAIMNFCNYFNVPKDITQGILLGLIEMTNGCYLMSISKGNFLLVMSVVSFLMCFSGFSVVAQVYSLTYKLKLSLKRYVGFKFLQGILGSISTYAVFSLFYVNKKTSVFNNGARFLPSDFFLIISLILIIPFILHNIRKLFNAS